MSDRDGAGRFQTGSIGGPGRPKGSRNRLSEGLLSALADDFDQHGAEVIRRVREEDPAAYLRACAALVPKVIRLDEADPLADLIDEELVARIRALNDQIAAAGGPRLCLPIAEDGEPVRPW